MRVVIVGDSIKSNSLGRVISMAITARSVFARVDVFAFDDGSVWLGADQFGIEVTALNRQGLRALADDLEQGARTEPIVVWISKGAAPLPWFAGMLRQTRNITIVADFDDHDVSIMRSFRAQSSANRIKMNRLRRKHPANLLRSQRRLAQHAQASTFSNSALKHAYSKLLGIDPRLPQAIIPHSRVDPAEILPQRADRLHRVGFPGTVRAHKGASQLVGLMRANRELQIVTFEQAWRPPDDCDSQWLELPPSTPLWDIYSQIDFVVLPMSTSDPASLYQLPAKLVDAASMGCPVACTLTTPIAEFASSAVLAVDDWNTPEKVVASIWSADARKLSAQVREVYESRFSPEATGKEFIKVAREAVKEATRG